MRPDSEVVVVRFRPVARGASVRLRISETYTDPKRYRIDGDELVWDRSFGRPRNAVVLPAGWMLSASSIPATVSETDDGRIRLDFVNPRPDEIEVLVHPQQIIHSLVEYADGSTLAQLGPPDMRPPIACAFAWPDRLPWPAPKLDLVTAGPLTFQHPDPAKFPALSIAKQALAAGGQAPAAMNAANERAVSAFLDRRIGFLDIPNVVAETLERMDRVATSATTNGSSASAPSLIVFHSFSTSAPNFSAPSSCTSILMRAL